MGQKSMMYIVLLYRYTHIYIYTCTGTEPNQVHLAPTNDVITADTNCTQYHTVYGEQVTQGMQLCHSYTQAYKCNTAIELLVRRLKKEENDQIKKEKKYILH